MAWASKKQYAILMSSEEGKDLAENLPDMDQDAFNSAFSKLLGQGGGSTSSEEKKANIDALKKKRMDAINKYNKTGDEKYSKEASDLEEQIDKAKAQKFDSDMYNPKKGSIDNIANELVKVDDSYSTDDIKDLVNEYISDAGYSEEELNDILQKKGNTYLLDKINSYYDFESEGFNDPDYDPDSYDDDDYYDDDHEDEEILGSSDNLKKAKEIYERKMSGKNDFKEWNEKYSEIANLAGSKEELEKLVDELWDNNIINGSEIDEILNSWDDSKDVKNDDTESAKEFNRYNKNPFGDDTTKKPENKKDTSLKEDIDNNVKHYFEDFDKEDETIEGLRHRLNELDSSHMVGSTQIREELQRRLDEKLKNDDDDFDEEEYQRKSKEIEDKYNEEQANIKQEIDTHNKEVGRSVDPETGQRYDADTNDVIEENISGTNHVTLQTNHIEGKNKEQIMQTIADKFKDEFNGDVKVDDIYGHYAPGYGGYDLHVLTNEPFDDEGHNSFWAHIQTGGKPNDTIEQALGKNLTKVPDKEIKEQVPDDVFSRYYEPAFGKDFADELRDLNNKSDERESQLYSNGQQYSKSDIENDIKKRIDDFIGDEHTKMSEDSYYDSHENDEALGSLMDYIEDTYGGQFVDYAYGLISDKFTGEGSYSYNKKQERLGRRKNNDAKSKLEAFAKENGLTLDQIKELLK